MGNIIVCFVGGEGGLGDWRRGRRSKPKVKYGKDKGLFVVLADPGSIPNSVSSGLDAESSPVCGLNGGRGLVKINGGRLTGKLTIWVNSLRVFVIRATYFANALILFTVSASSEILKSNHSFDFNKNFNWLFHK